MQINPTFAILPQQRLAQQLSNSLALVGSNNWNTDMAKQKALRQAIQQGRKSANEAGLLLRK